MEKPELLLGFLVGMRVEEGDKTGPLENSMTTCSLSLLGGMGILGIRGS